MRTLGKFWASGIVAVVAGGLLVAAVGPTTAGSPVAVADDAAASSAVLPGGGGIVIDTDPDCSIEDQSVLFDEDDGRNVDLDVLVLLDGVSVAHANWIFADVGAPYGQIGVTVVPTYEVVDPPFTGTAASGLIRQAKQRFTDAKVPAEYDLVEVLTSKDIEHLGQTSVAGLADCIGGVADDKRAYEVSEAGAPPSGTSAMAVAGPQITSKKRAAKITAHEMGHLMGAQHHYANCVEGIDPATEVGDFGPCTLMFNDASALSLNFSTVNSRVARGYALRYASANDAT